MKILSLATRNFRNLTDREWKFDARFQVVKGPNEAGKSSLLEAVLAALYGDATSTDKRYEGYRRWNSAEHIHVALDLALKVGQVKLERDFENRKNRYTLGDKTVQAKDKVRSFLAEHLPIAVEESFRQTACVRQDEIKSDIDPSQLKSQLENRSLSSTGHDLANLQKELDSHNSDLRRGLVTIAPKNPGPIKVLEDDLQRLRHELAQREGSEREAGAAVTDFEVADARIEKMTRDLSQGEERQDLDKKYVEAETLYKQKESEIGDLTAKKERLRQLPQLAVSAQEDVRSSEQSLNEKRAKRDQAQGWKAKNDTLKKAEGDLARLAADVQKLEQLSAQMNALTNPLSSLNFTPADFARFNTLEQEFGKGQRELGEIGENELRLTKEIEGEQARSTSLDQEQAALAQTIAMLEAEQTLAKQAHEARDRQQQLLAQHQRVSEKVAQIVALASDRFRSAQELEAYTSVAGVDRKRFEDAVASAQALEKAIQDEGIGFEIEPEQAVQITVQTDNGSEAEVLVSRTQKFTARRTILVQVPGLGRLRLTNESLIALQLEQRRSQIAGILSQASASGVDDMLARFRQRDELVARLSHTDATLTAVLDSRTKEGWEEDAAGLAERLKAMSSELEKLGSARELQTVDQDLSRRQKRMNQLEKGRTEAATRLMMLTKSLGEAQKILRYRQQDLAGIEREIEVLLQKASQQDAAGLKALEGQCQEYARLTAVIQDQRARVLDGRHEADVRSRHEAEKENIGKLTAEFETLTVWALSDSQLLQLANEISALEGALKKKSDYLSGIQKEKELLEAERLDDKYARVVTQAAVADQNMRDFRSYAFKTPGERIDFGREMKALKDELEKLRNTRAELKVKSDSAGLNQERISELKEAIAENERRMERLKHRLEIDSTVLRYLQEARTKALADLLAAIPAGVGDLLNRITAGRYQRVDGNGFDLQVWSAEKGDNLEQDEMSSGSLDQFYLALRLEAIRSIFADDLPPLILDDPLASCDPMRRSRIIEILDEHANSGQVIYLTCHDWPELDRFACLQLP
ncbi:MAG: AAA family ATPase [Terriglobia bacterium]